MKRAKGKLSDSLSHSILELYIVLIQVRQILREILLLLDCLFHSHPNMEFVWSLFSRIRTVNLRIQSEYGKIRTKKIFVFGHFSLSYSFGSCS